MSEDIDIKVLLAPPKSPLRKGMGNRVRLKALHEHINELLETLGFPLIQSNNGENPHIRNAHRYYAVGAGYRTIYQDLPSLRPEIKLELIQRQPLLPVEPRTFGYLHEELTQLPLSSPLTINCISVAETTAEKIVSLLRRYAYKRDGYQKRGNIDPTLVRHIYDVARITELSPSSLINAREIFPQLVMNDKNEFNGQNPEFDKNPFQTLKRTLEYIKSSDELKTQYEKHLIPLVYDQSPPSFEESFSKFEVVAQSFLETC